MHYIFSFYQRKAVAVLVCLMISWMSDPAKAQSTAGIDVESPVAEKDQEIKFSLTLDKVDWTYQLKEEAVFKVEVEGGETLMQDGEVYYSIGPEKMLPTKKGKVNLRDGRAQIKSEGMMEPGFLRCNVSMEINGEKYSATATAAYEPQKIKPTTSTPKDFKEYWTSVVKKSKTVPLNTQLTPMPHLSTEAVEVYQVEYEFYNDGIQKFYGVLSLPRSKDQHPAIVRFPGAGWAPLSGDQQNAAKGFITLDLYIHAHPVIESPDYYETLKNNELKDYMYKGIVDRDSFYYKNVILGCVRSIDLIYSLPDFNGRVGAWGSSQGGALSIITTSLEPRINNFVALCPAMCDFTGYLHDRAGGWPHLFAKPELYQENKDQVMKTLSYYDVVNFAKQLKVPGYFSWGFNDPTTPPTSFYSAFNRVKSPKKLFVIPEGVHKIYPEQRKKTYDWLLKTLK